MTAAQRYQNKREKTNNSHKLNLNSMKISSRIVNLDHANKLNANSNMIGKTKTTHHFPHQKYTNGHRQIKAK